MKQGEAVEDTGQGAAEDIGREAVEDTSLWVYTEIFLGNSWALKYIWIFAQTNGGYSFAPQ